MRRANFSGVFWALAASAAAALWWRRAQLAPVVIAPSPEQVATPPAPATRRALAVDLVRRYVPSDTGSAAFDEVARDYGGKGTTCGYLPGWLLWRLGCRETSLVNRQEPAAGLRYRPGANISALRWNPYFAVFKGGARPRPGDIYLISNGPPATEHVGVVVDVAGDGWVCADAGQRNAKGEQCARLVARRLRADGMLERADGISEPRRIQGWVDLDKVPFTAPAMLQGPQIT